MRRFWGVLITLLLLNCSTTRLVDSWVNKEYVAYKPHKVLVVGVTDNLIARKMFEEKLVSELKIRNIDAIESYEVFETTFLNERQTEENIQKEVDRISKNGFDAVLISVVKGVDEKTVYTSDIFGTNYYWGRFGHYYYVYQDVFFEPGYYEKYKIYNIETTLYNLKENNDKSLVWIASFNMVDPKTIDKSVKDYVRGIITSLEKEAIIPSINKY